MVEQQSTQHVSPLVHLGKQDSKNKSSGESKTEKREDSNDVTTDLELKTPGSTEDQVSCCLLDRYASIAEIINYHVRI